MKNLLLIIGVGLVGYYLYTTSKAGCNCSDNKTPAPSPDLTTPPSTVGTDTPAGVRDFNASKQATGVGSAVTTIQLAPEASQPLNFVL